MIFRTDHKLNGWLKLALSCAIFVALALLYLQFARERFLENPEDKIAPLPGQMWQWFERLAFTADRDGNVRLWLDTWVSGYRLAMGVALAFLAIPLGVFMGLFPAWEALLLRFMLVFDKVPTIVLLPILFCVLGTGEMLKVAIIFLGLFPKITLDAYLRCKSTPQERIQKALTMNATGLEVALRVVLPQHLPRLLDTIRLNLGPAVAYLFMSESLGSTEGLGYRIFLFQKNVNMAGIVVYAAWATLLMFVADLGFRLWIRWRYRWLDKE